MENFTIEILNNGVQLNILLYIKSDIDKLSITDREELFAESFFSMAGDTVRSLDGNSHRKCDSWDKVVFSINSGPNNEVTKVNMNSLMSLTPNTLGQFIESKYQSLFQ